MNVKAERIESIIQMVNRNLSLVISHHSESNIHNVFMICLILPIITALFCYLVRYDSH